jgi:drug/metabolite transporter (DMT)-like permease
VNRTANLALTAALLFGISTPLAKSLLGEVPPLVLAALLYLGSGAGLACYRGMRFAAGSRERWRMPAADQWPWLIAAIALGGIAAPIAMLYGLRASSASSASLLLNLEAVFTALLAWFLFRENFDRRVALGMLAIVAGGVVLVVQPAARPGLSSGSLFICAACLFWAIDNNLTRRVSDADATLVASLKGVIAGCANLALAFSQGQSLPTPVLCALAGLVGLLGYGVSLVLFVRALRELGTARTSAYFSVAPFFGALCGVVLLGDGLTPQLLVASLLMALGVWLHLSERHVHEHVHESMNHDHEHRHDLHHQHRHEFEWDGHEPHTHEHRHEAQAHAHGHFPDLHHRHPH